MNLKKNFILCISLVHLFFVFEPYTCWAGSSFSKKSESLENCYEKTNKSRQLVVQQMKQKPLPKDNLVSFLGSNRLAENFIRWTKMPIVTVKQSQIIINLNRNRAIKAANNFWFGLLSPVIDQSIKHQIDQQLKKPLVYKRVGIGNQNLRQFDKTLRTENKKTLSEQNKIALELLLLEDISDVNQRNQNQKTIKKLLKEPRKVTLSNREAFLVMDNNQPIEHIMRKTLHESPDKLLLLLSYDQLEQASRINKIESTTQQQQAKTILKQKLELVNNYQEGLIDWGTQTNKLKKTTNN